MVDAVVARLRGGDATLPAWSLDEVQRNGLATGLTALAASLGLFDDASDDVRAYAAEQRAEVARRAERFTPLTPRILAALADADIPAVPVKGAVLGGSSGDGAVWADPTTRPMSDIDLLVDPRHRTLAAAVLERAGCRLHASADHEDTYLAWGDGSVGRTDGESAEHNGRVEVHPGWTEFLHGYLVRGFDPLAVAVRRDDGQWRLPPAAFAAHVVGHLASTVVRCEVRAVNVLDVWFLHAAGTDWHEVAHEMRRIDPRLTAPGLWLADRLTPGLLPSEVVEGELRRLPNRAVLSSTEPAAVLREPTQRTTARWRESFAMGAGDRVGIGRQLVGSVVGRLR